MKRVMLTAVLMAAAMMFSFPASAHAASPGWSSANGEWYFFNGDGSPANGVQVINGEAYTFDTSGRMVLDGVHIDGLEDDLLEKAYVTTAENWDQILLALDDLNRARAESGVGPVALDYGLCIVSAYRAAHLIKHDYASHWKSDGTFYAEETATLLFGNETAPSEVLVREGSNYPLKYTIDRIRTSSFIKLMKSDGHRRTMLKPVNTRVGIGAVLVNDASTGMYSFVFLENFL